MKKILSIRNPACSCWECRNRRYDFQRCWDYDEMANRQEEFFDYWKKLEGETIVLGYSENVSPNALRSGENNLHFFAEKNLHGIPGNSNRNIRRMEGWRGTTDDISVNADGVWTVINVEKKIRKTLVTLESVSD